MHWYTGIANQAARRKLAGVFIFLLVLLGIYAWYRYQDILFYPPQSVHRWRQTDCASLTLNYYQHGMKFFQPQVHSLTSDGGTTGYSCTSEVPLLYYNAAILYKIFSPNDAFLRGINLFLFTLGLLHLYLLGRLYFKGDWFWPMILPLFFAGSPLLVYYANNYLSDMAALSCSWMAAFYFLLWYKHKKTCILILAMVFMAVASALKITALLLPLALLGVIFLEFTNLIRLDKDERVFGKPWLLVAGILLTVLLIAAWVLFAKKYNAIHQSTYFSTMIRPLWTQSETELQAVWTNLRNVWFPVYLNPFSWSLLLASALLLVVLRKHADRLLLHLAWILLAGASSFFLLEFWFFKDHDYYAINLYILPVFVLLAFLNILQNRFPRIYKSGFVKASLLLFLLPGFWTSRKNLEIRYTEPLSGMAVHADYLGVKPWLRKAGVQNGDKIISLPGGDHSSLYRLNQPGWTEYFEWGLKRGDEFQYNSDSAGIRQSIRRGAKYLIVYGTDALFSRPFLNGYTHHLAGIYKNIWIFDLAATDTNFRPAAPQVQSKIVCDVESLSTDGTFLTDSTGNWKIVGVGNRYQGLATSGNYSCRIDNSNPYGLTITFDSVRAGQIFELSCKMVTSGESVSFVAQAEDAGLYYQNQQLIAPGKKPWKTLSSSFCMPFRMDGKSLKLYVYNPDTAAAYVDDLIIRQFKSPLENLNPPFWIK